MRSKLIFYCKTAFNIPIYAFYPRENKYWHVFDLEKSPYNRMNLRPVTWVGKIASAGLYR